MELMVLKAKFSIKKDDIAAVIKTGEKSFNFFLRGGHLIEVDAVSEEEKKKIIADFFPETDAAKVNVDISY